MLGEKHPDYATSLNNLARLYQSMGDYAKAEPLYLTGAGDPQAGAGREAPRLRNQPEQPGRALQV